jgi:N-acetyltransferase
MSAKAPAPITMTGRAISLVPLAMDHLADLFAAGGGDEDVWRWQGGPAPRTEAELGRKLASLLDGAARGECIPFAVIHLASGRAIGWTMYLDIDAPNERLEIGWTWYGRAFWRTAVNSEAKLLLLTHAFEELGMGRVQWKTDQLNRRSLEAIARLGARQEGTFRRHKQRPDGTWRDTVYFSMLADEWPAAKARLAARLEAPGSSAGPWRRL